ncbi:hypothetical protein, partial [Anaerotruncus massiliensis (ex Liu et al. 2021)]|uniref:hypothetical protein n=1 Tax=Anaerotruncus massiliensis (ex Liu et al. 2021) TaxID=2321404 RepID=UPI003AB7CFE4
MQHFLFVFAAQRAAEDVGGRPTAVLDCPLIERQSCRVPPRRANNDYQNACKKFIAERQRFFEVLQQVDFLAQHRMMQCEKLRWYKMD